MDDAQHSAPDDGGPAGDEIVRDSGEDTVPPAEDTAPVEEAAARLADAALSVEDLESADAATPPADADPEATGSSDAPAAVESASEPEETRPHDDLSMGEWLQRVGAALPVSELPDDGSAGDSEAADASAAATGDEAGEEPTSEPETPAAEAEADTGTPDGEEADALDDMVGQLREDGDEGEPSEQSAGEADEGEAAQGAEGAEGEAPEGAEGEGAEGEDEGSEEPAEPEDAGAVAEGVELVRDRLAARLPYWIYSGVWVVFIGVMTYLMWPVASDPFVEGRLYAYLVFGGLGLVLGGLVLLGALWLWLRSSSEGEERTGLARAMLVRWSTSTAFGVLCWWVGLLVLDLHRIGRLG